MASGTLLHVDDSKHMRELVRQAVLRCGVEVGYQGFPSGIEALAWLRAAPAGQGMVLVLDLHMPDMSGLELLAALKQEGLRQRWPVVMLTSSTDPEDRCRCLAEGVDRYCTKPKDLFGFIALAREIAELHRQGPASTG